MLSKRVKLILLVVVLSFLLPASYLLSTPAPEAFAHVLLEVNPALVLTVDSWNQILAVELKGGQAEDVFSGIDFTGMDLEQALKLIAERLDGAGFLSDENRVLLTVFPAEGIEVEKVANLSGQLEMILSSQMEILQLSLPVEVLVLDSALYNTAQEAGVLPSDYAALARYGVSAETIAALLKIGDPAGLSGQALREHHYRIFEAYMDMIAAGLTEAEAFEILNKASAITPVGSEIYEIASGFVDMQDVGIPLNYALRLFEFSQGIDPQLFKMEISTIISDMIDMHEVGISGETAIAALGMAVAADYTLRELSTIISAIIDLKEYGISEAEALTRVRQAIAVDPSLEKLDDSLEKAYPDDQNDQGGYEEDYDDLDNGKQDDDYLNRSKENANGQDDDQLE